MQRSGFLSGILSPFTPPYERLSQQYTETFHTSCTSHFNLGRVQLMKRQLRAAKRSFERALSYDPNYLPAHQGLAFIRSQGEEL
jgi:Tfp pilus assembly protein PilF